MSTVFSVPSNLLLPYLASLSPDAVTNLRKLRHAGQQSRERSIDCQDPLTQFSNPSFSSFSYNSPLIPETEITINTLQALSDMEKQQRPRTVVNDRDGDLATSFVPVVNSTTQPVCDVYRPSAQGSALCRAGVSTTTTSNQLSPILGNMILSSCPGKKVRLTGAFSSTPSDPLLFPFSRFQHWLVFQLQQSAMKIATVRSAINRDLTADLGRIASLHVKLIINCLSDKELSFLGSPWP
jgi:hypothetical protein